MNIYEDHQQWVESLAPGSTISGAAELIGVAPSTLTRYLKRNNGQLDADYIIRIALAYKVSPTRALVETGKIPEDTLDQKPPTGEEKRRLLLEIAEEIAQEQEEDRN